jgi:hypothetical protein
MPGPDGDGDSDSHGDCNVHQDALSDRNGHTTTNEHCDCDSYPYSHAHAICDGYAHGSHQHALQSHAPTAAGRHAPDAHLRGMRDMHARARGGADDSAVV